MDYYINGGKTKLNSEVKVIVLEGLLAKKDEEIGELKCVNKQYKQKLSFYEERLKEIKEENKSLQMQLFGYKKELLNNKENRENRERDRDRANKEKTKEKTKEVREVSNKLAKEFVNLMTAFINELDKYREIETD